LQGITSNEANTEVAQLRQSQMLLLVLGLAALVLGILVYILDRPSTVVYFVPDSWRVAENTPLLFGVLGNFLPAFSHALAFALFSTAIAGRRYIGYICVGWFVAEVFFELAQIDSIAYLIASLLPSWFAGSPLLENVPSHFLMGQFDAIDVLFLAFGCYTAWYIADKILPQSFSRPRSQLTGTPRSVRLAALLLVTFIGLTSIVGSGGTGDATIIVAANAAMPTR
jgi:hypothetical protein